MDTVVFDIETQNFFTDPEVGWNNYNALRLSVLGVYSYAQDKYISFEEAELREALPIFEGSGQLVGFSISRFDLPVLNRYFQKIEPNFNLFDKQRLDLLDEIEMATGWRVSLERLAQANLGRGKSGQSFEAGSLFAEGRMEELKAYCLKDVEITRALYEQYKKEGYFWIPDRLSGELVKIEFRRGLFAP